MYPSLKIGNHTISEDKPVFVIAEAGANHNGDISLAKKLIDIAKDSGADSVKFQTFSADEFIINNKKNFTYFSQGKQQTSSELELLKKLEFNRVQWKEIIDYCRKINITFFTTIQDPKNLKMMLELGLEAIKVGSDDFDHLDYLKEYAKSGLPLILSRGMSDQKEIGKIINTIEPLSSGGLAVLHCVSLYPSELSYLNLNQIKTLKKLFPNVVWGFSDHSQSTMIPALSVASGAKIIEKHYTIDHSLPGPDHWFSMNPKQLKEMISNIRKAEEALGGSEILVSAKESKVKDIMRRRVVILQNANAGTDISKLKYVFKRAEEGIFIEDWKSFLNKGYKLKINKKVGDTIIFEDLILN